MRFTTLTLAPLLTNEFVGSSTFIRNRDARTVNAISPPGDVPEVKERLRDILQAALVAAGAFYEAERLKDNHKARNNIVGLSYPMYKTLLSRGKLADMNRDHWKQITATYQSMKTQCATASAACSAEVDALLEAILEVVDVAADVLPDAREKIRTDQAGGHQFARDIQQFLGLPDSGIYRITDRSSGADTRPQTHPGADLVNRMDRGFPIYERMKTHCVTAGEDCSKAVAAFLRAYAGSFLPLMFDPADPISQNVQRGLMHAGETLSPQDAQNFAVYFQQIEGSFKSIFQLLAPKTSN